MNLSNTKYAAIVAAVGSAVASGLLQYSTTYTWIPIVLTGISTVTALFAPPPTKKVKNGQQ